MEAIFGETRDEKGDSDHWKPACDMMWSNVAQQRFTKGSITVVSDVPDKPTVEDIEAWERSKVKDYKVRVINFGDALMNLRVSDHERI